MPSSDLPDSPADRVSWVISAPDQREMRRRYDLWARRYDSDLGDFDSYLAPAKTAEVAKAHLSSGDRVLDAGAGTGLSGAALKAVGFDDLIAVDFSPGMLAVAEAKGVYRLSVCADFDGHAPFADHAFDAVVTVGTTSQMPAESLREMVRVARPGGRIVFTVWPAAYVERGYARIQRELEARSRLALIHEGEAFQALPTSEPDIWYQVRVFDVLG